MGQLDLKQPACSVAITKDASYVAVGCPRGLTAVCRTRRPNEDITTLAWLSAEDSIVRRLRFSADSKTLFATTGRKQVRMWPNGCWLMNDPKSPPATSKFIYQHRSPISSMAVNNDGSLVASGTTTGDIVVSNTDTLTHTILEGIPGTVVSSLVFSPNSSQLVAGWYKPLHTGEVAIYNIQNRKRLERMAKSTEMVLDVQISPNGRYFLVSTIDGLEMWDFLEGIKLHSTLCPTVNVIEFAPDGKAFAVGNVTGEVTVWGVKNFGPISLASNGVGTAVLSLAMGHDRPVLASASKCGAMFIHELEIVSILPENIKKLYRKDEPKPPEQTS